MLATHYASLVRERRVGKGLSQEDIAKRIGISRPSYVAVEQGHRDLTLGEFEKLSTMLSISFEEIEQGVVPNYEKYKQMVVAYLRESGTLGIKKTKLAKLLYLSDFAWYYTHLESMSGMSYRRIQFGPVPDEYFRVLEELESEGKMLVAVQHDDGKTSYTLTESEGNALQKLDAITKDELVFIRKIYKKWEHRNTAEVVNFTHEQLPYKICRPNEIIPYELITQQDPQYVY